LTKLTEKERLSFEKIMEQDLVAINQQLMNQIKDFWDKARQEVIVQKGWDKLIEEKKALNEKAEEIRKRINEIEAEMNSETLKPEQMVELGGKPNDYGRYSGESFYGIPVTSQFEYDIVEYIREHINLEVPVKFLHDLGRACIRELAMSGTFEEARDAYQKFYSMDFRKYGVDIPPRLSDVKKQRELLGRAKEVLAAQVTHETEKKIPFSKSDAGGDPNSR